MAYTTIDNPGLFFNTVTWSGDGATGRSITGVGFQPDWVWIKNRSTTNEHLLFDVIRGVQVALNSNDTTADDTISNSLTAFNSDGFSVSGNASCNASSSNYVGWDWKAGGSASSNSDGSITSSVSVNTTAGFSICAFNGNSGTVGHGLGAKPDFLVVKSRQTAGSNNWVLTHSALGTNMADKYLILNGTDAVGTSSNVWGGEPTSTTFTVASAVAANDNNIAYLFTEKKGYSKFGSYTGNGNADGTFVYTGFRPAWVMCRDVDNAAGWHIFDNKRPNAFNVINKRLEADNSDAENSTSGCEIDLVSNGFKLRGNFDNINRSGSNHIFMAFAEAPFVTAGTKAAGTAR